MNEYDKQANDFLSKHNIKFKATLTEEDKCPLFCDGKHIHGNRHRVTFSRAGERFQFYFWNSYNDARTQKPVRAYDVISCLTKYDPGSFEDFCSEFGYDTDSRKAEKTYKAVVKEWEKVERFFTTEEIEEMREI